MKSRAALIALVAYVVVLALLVLWPTHPESVIQPQLTAFIAVLAAHQLTFWITYGLINSVANILLFAPMTLLAVLAFGRWWWFLVFAAGAAASALAELGQALFLPGRTPDVWDIIAGSIGSLLGTAIGALIQRKKRRHPTEQASDGASGE